MPQQSKQPNRARLFVDMDNVLVDFPSGLNRVDPSIRAGYEFVVDVPGLFGLMDPKPGVVEAFKELSELFDAYILSTAPWGNPSAWSDKIEWVHGHFGADDDSVAYKRLILSHHKNLVRGTYIIDDGTLHGVDKFDGRHIHFGTDEFPDWDSVLAYLRPRAW